MSWSLEKEARLRDLIASGVEYGDALMKLSKEENVEQTEAQQDKTQEDVEAVVARIAYDKRFRVGVMGEGYFVQIQYDEPDIHTGNMELQRGRKWYVSPWATDSEIVQTCLTAALASAEHQVREHFGYRPFPNRPARAIYGPHFSADHLWDICSNPDSYDARADPE